MKNRKREIDINILESIKQIKWPLKNYQDANVYVRDFARNENGFEHISGKNHYLKVRDIELLPQILKNPTKVLFEKNGRKGKTYFGIRKGQNKSKYLKIVVKIRKSGDEEIITIYPNKIIK